MVAPAHKELTMSAEPLHRVVRMLALPLARVAANDPKPKAKRVAEPTVDWAAVSPQELGKKLKKLEAQMYAHAQNLEFEQAAKIRDEIAKIKAAGLMS